MKRLLYALSFLIFASTAGVTAFPARYIVRAQNAPATDNFADYALLKHISSCESWGDPDKEPRQFHADGSLIVGQVDPDDIGLAQINVPTWGKIARQLGFDIYTYEGNLAMAKWIFDNDPRHAANWNASKGCWGKYDLQGV